MNNIFEEIKKERERQDEKWGEQDHPPIVWVGILGEEFGEVSQAAIESVFEEFGGHDLDDYRKELIQTAAVCVAAVQSLDRSETKELDSHSTVWTPVDFESGMYYPEPETGDVYEVITYGGKMYRGFFMDWGFVLSGDDEVTLEEIGEEISFYRKLG